MAHVHQRNLPAAVAGRLEQIIRMCLWLVFALQETQITVSRLRRVLFGKAFETSTPAPVDSFAASPPGSDETNAGVVLQADADDTDATSGQASPQAKPKGGHRPGTGRLGGEPLLSGPALLPRARLPSAAWGAGARCGTKSSRLRMPENVAAQGELIRCVVQGEPTDSSRRLSPGLIACQGAHRDVRHSVGGAGGRASDLLVLFGPCARR